jgi:REP element-mobilizing transposase RayT
MPRQARLDSPGTLHHIIVRGIEKNKIVADKYDQEKFLSLIGDLAQETDTAIYAWALMTNHAHILLKSGPYGLSHFMRRLLTGYAIYYNNRHKRHGHLFQNRYKSIVCDEDAYFKELVRYIHLNPLRAKLVNNLLELDIYPWAGHSSIMGQKKREWQDINYALSWFGQNDTTSRKNYRQFVENGIDKGKRDDLVGGGLVHTLGGWSQVLTLRKSKGRVLSDERILGGNEFVERVIDESGARIKRQLSINERKIHAKKKIRDKCAKAGININELTGGSRRGQISKLRAQLALDLVENYGLSLAEAGRQLGVSTSAISKIFTRANK